MSIALGPETCGRLDESAAREWLVADGLGGYAMGTAAGLRTRRYHGLLVPAVGGPASGPAAPSVRTETTCSSRSISRTAFRAGAGRSATWCSSASWRWFTDGRPWASSTGCSAATGRSASS